MGPADRALNLPERLRPWVSLGLTDVLVPGSNVRTRPPVAQPSPRQQVGQAPTRPPASQGPKTRAQQPPAQQSAPSTPRSDQFVELPDRWIEFIQPYLEGTRMVWTYFELGLNKWLKPDPKRSQLFLNLIHMLKLPKGSIGFCPMSEPAGDVLIPRPEYFWESVQRIGANLVGCFGDASFRALCPRASRGSFHITDSGRFVHVLPDPNLLMSMPEPQRLASVQHLREAILASK